MNLCLNPERACDHELVHVISGHLRKSTAVLTTIIWKMPLYNMFHNISIIGHKMYIFNFWKIHHKLSLTAKLFPWSPIDRWRYRIYLGFRPWEITYEFRPETFRSDRYYPTFIRTCILLFPISDILTGFLGSLRFREI